MSDPRDLPGLDQWLTDAPDDEDDMRSAMDDDRDPDDADPICGQFYDGG
jgi:hypothetical protein